MPNIATSRRFAAAGGDSLTFQDVTSNNSSATITIPAGASESGDEFVVLFDTAFHNSAVVPTSVVPTGFTQITDYLEAGQSRTKVIVSYKKLTSGDAGASVTGMNDDQMTKQLVRYSFSSAISTITVQDLEVYDAGTDIASVTIGASAGTTPLVAMGYASANNAPSVSASWTPDYSDGQTDTGIVTLVEGDAQNSSGSDVTWDPSDVGTRNISITFYLEVA